MFFTFLHSGLPLKSPVGQHEELVLVLTEVNKVKVHSDRNGTGM